VRKCLEVLAAVAVLCALSWAQAPAQASPSDSSQAPAQTPAAAASQTPDARPAGRHSAGFESNRSRDNFDPYSNKTACTILSAHRVIRRLLLRAGGLLQRRTLGSVERMECVIRDQCGLMDRRRRGCQPILRQHQDSRGPRPRRFRHAGAIRGSVRLGASPSTQIPGSTTLFSGCTFRIASMSAGRRLASLCFGHDGVRVQPKPSPPAATWLKSVPVSQF